MFHHLNPESMIYCLFDFVNKLFISCGTAPIYRDTQGKMPREKSKQLLSGIKKKVALKVKIRYNHKEAGAELHPAGNKAKIVFKKPQFAITPGQSAVFYKENRVLGGAIIDKVVN